MKTNLVMLALAGGLALTGLRQAEAGEAPRFAPAASIESGLLDGLPIEYARHTREHRMWEIQRRTQRQQARRGYGPYRGYAQPGYGPRYRSRGYVPYQGRDRGPPGYYGRPYPRPYAGPGNGPPGSWR